MFKRETWTYSHKFMISQSFVQWTTNFDILKKNVIVFHLSIHVSQNIEQWTYISCSMANKFQYCQ
jgi:hypothetical protein